MGLTVLDCPTEEECSRLPDRESGWAVFCAKAPRNLWVLLAFVLSILFTRKFATVGIGFMLYCNACV